MKQLEPRNQCPDMQDGLQARVHDPLWLLARQWQTGEFRADDAGSPVGAQLQLETVPLTRYRPGPATAAAMDYAPARTPLETCVEREPISAAPNVNLRAAAQAGLHFTRLLSLRGLAKYTGPFISSFALRPPTEAERGTLDTTTLNYLAVMAQRVINGAALYAKLAPARVGSAPVVFPAEAPFKAVLATDLSAMVQAATEWVDWYDGLFSQPKPGETAWVKERMEYTFTVAGNTSRGELAMTAPEYYDGRLDWYSFDLDAAQTLGATGGASTTATTFLPAPVSFRGMPASRYWEMEDGGVNFANIEAAPQDLARALLVTFALEFGNDWFLVPVAMPVGSLSLVRALVVTNTFGQKLLVQHTTKVDGAQPAWRMFGLSSAQAAATPDPGLKFMDAFFLPPVLGLSLEGAPVEDVLLLRDEMANMAWAVERTIESPGGQRLDRHESFAQKRQQHAATAGANGSQTSAPGRLWYRLGTGAPDFWIPLLPVLSGATVQLKRGTLPGAPSGAVAQPQGRILEPGRELLLRDEEVPREGARVTRSYQYARWIDGSTQLWAGRKKQPGRGEGSSGLRFDVLEALPTATSSSDG
ncbi:MAG TPA: hypothetical protein VGC87_01500 [Pyrinomonadaceae bacterium]